MNEIKISQSLIGDIAACMHETMREEIKKRLKVDLGALNIDEVKLMLPLMKVITRGLFLNVCSEEHRILMELNASTQALEQMKNNFLENLYVMKKAFFEYVNDGMV